MPALLAIRYINRLLTGNTTVAVKAMPEGLPITHAARTVEINRL